MSSKYGKVIVALDYESPEPAYRLVEEIGDKIEWFKVGPQLFTRSGAQVLSFLHRQGKNIFLDLKLYDTPIVVAETVKQFADMGVQFATVHCSGGKPMLEAAASACRGSKLKILGVTLLTSQETTDSRILAWGQDETAVVSRLLDLAIECRLSGILCSPHEVETARPRALPGFLLVTPGIRLPGEEVFRDDQKRVASPAEALSWGADYIVIGRPITQAREPREVVDRLFKNVMSPMEITSLSAIDHMLTHCPSRVQRVVIQSAQKSLGGRLQGLHDKAKAARVPVEISTKPTRAGADPVRAIVAPFRYQELGDLLDRWEKQPKALVLVLDHLQDPQNFGALCRTAEGLGASGVLLPKDRSVAVGPGVYHASVGAVETLPIALVHTLGDVLRKLKDHGFWIVGASMSSEAKPPSAMPPLEKAALVLGAEYEGLSPALEKHCDWLVRLPLRGKVESLNVSVAGALLMHELLRAVNPA